MATIRYADEKKVKAIYTMVEEEINERLDGYESGNVETSSWEEVKQKAKLFKKG